MFLFYRDRCTRLQCSRPTPYHTILSDKPIPKFNIVNPMAHNKISPCILVRTGQSYRTRIFSNTACFISPGGPRTEQSMGTSCLITFGNVAPLESQTVSLLTRNSMPSGYCSAGVRREVFL